MMKKTITTYLSEYKLHIKEFVVIGKDTLFSSIKSCTNWRKQQQLEAIKRPVLAKSVNFKIITCWNHFQETIIRGLNISKLKVFNGQVFEQIAAFLDRPIYPFLKIKPFFVEKKAPEIYFEPSSLLKALFKGQSIDHLIQNWLYNVYYIAVMRVMSVNPKYNSIHVTEQAKFSVIPKDFQIPVFDPNKVVSVLFENEYWTFKAECPKALIELMLILYVSSSLMLRASIVTPWLYLPLFWFEIKGEKGWTPFKYSYPIVPIVSGDQSSVDSIQKHRSGLIEQINLHIDYFESVIVPELIGIKGVRIITPRVTWYGSLRILNYNYISKFFTFFLRYKPVGHHSIETPYGDIYLPYLANRHLIVAMEAVFTELKRLKL